MVATHSPLETVLQNGAEFWNYARKQVLTGKYFDVSVKVHEVLRLFFDGAFSDHKEGL